jgi:hypothetical protein
MEESMKEKVKKAATLVLVAMTAFSGVWALDLGDIWANLAFGVASHPEDRGNVTEAYLRYPFSNSFSSQVKFVSKTTTQDSPIQAAYVTKSLNSINLLSNELFLLPVEVGVPLSTTAKAWLSGGLYLSNQGDTEVGYFIAEIAGSKYFFSYNDVLSQTFYGPLLDAEISLDLGSFGLDLEAGVVPYFWFNAAQTLKMDTLSLAPGSSNYNSTGYPYVFAVLKPKLKLEKILGIDISADIKYEFFHLSSQLLTLNSSYSGWTTKTQASDAHTVTAIGNLSIPLPNEGAAILGAGGKLSFINNDGTWSNKQALVVNLAFDLGK